MAWKEYDGEIVPTIRDDQPVRYRLRDGYIDIALARDLEWQWSMHSDDDYADDRDDIVAYELASVEDYNEVVKKDNEVYAKSMREFAFYIFGAVAVIGICWWLTMVFS